MKLRRIGGGEFDVEMISRDGESIRLRLGDREVGLEAHLVADRSAVVTIEGRSFVVAGARRGSAILVSVGPRNFEFRPPDESSRRHSRGLNAPEVTAPMPGKVLKVIVKQGDRVEAGQALVVIEAMKMETTLNAESDAIVKAVCVAPGQMVDHGAVLVELSPPPGPAGRESAPRDP